MSFPYRTPLPRGILLPGAGVVFYEYDYTDPGNLPSEPRVDPVRGVKASFIVPGPDGTARFTGIGNGGTMPYTAVDVMRCPQGHVTPSSHPGEYNHGCGFYAYSSYGQLRSGLFLAGAGTSMLPYYALLQVEHYGVTVSHAKGSRGEKQRVLSAAVSPWCYAHPGWPAAGFFLQVPIPFSCFCAPPGIYVTACPGHGDVISLADMASRLGTETVYHPGWFSTAIRDP